MPEAKFPFSGWDEEHIFSWEAKAESSGWAACPSGVVSGAAVPGNDASLHRAGGSRAGDGVASPVELAEEQQQWQQAASVARLQPLWSLGGPHVLDVLSLLLIRKSEQVSPCYSHILFWSYKHSLIKLRKHTAAACKRTMRLQTQVVWCENNCCSRWELFILGTNFCRLFAKSLYARYLYIFDVNSGHLMNENHVKKKKRGSSSKKQQNCN